mmetsp:Transcript_4479/g.6912  ORF Transcript_4479/g.6912 Transcript_4479/m.6912 type:complete len:342 (-) Transcript_4479:305-1330(-)
MLLLFVALVQKKPAIRTQRVRLLPSNSTPPSPPSTSPITIAYPTTPPPSSSSSSQHHKSGADQEGAFNLMALGMMEETVSSPRTARSNPIAHRARVGYGSNSIADILREGCSGSGESPAEMRLCFMQLETALKKGKSMGETRRMLSMWMKSHEPPRGRLRYEGHPGLGSQYPPACEETAARTINLLSKNITNKEWTALGPLERNKTKNASSSTISPGDVKKAVTVCPCGRLLASKDALRQHVIGVHFREECGYKCFMCNKTLSTNSNRRTHLLVHLKFRLHRCSTCDKGFADRSNLKRHLKKKLKCRPRSSRRRSKSEHPADQNNTKNEQILSSNTKHQKD